MRNGTETAVERYVTCLGGATPTPTPAPNTPTPTPGTATPTPTRTATPNGGPAGYTLCAIENGVCTFGGTASVAYGANGVFNFLNTTNMRCKAITAPVTRPPGRLRRAYMT